MSSRPDVASMHSLKVDNIPRDCKSDDLKDVFSKFGEVGDVYIPQDYHTRQPRGYAFVRFLEKADADEAEKEMNGKDIGGREVQVSYAQYPRNGGRRRRSRSRSQGRRREYSRDRRGGGRDYGRDANRRSRSRSRDRGARRRSYSR